MTIVQQFITIAIATVTNFITRWLPFKLFTSGKDDRDEPSPFIKGLGAFLPPAIMGMWCTATAISTSCPGTTAYRT